MNDQRLLVTPEDIVFDKIIDDMPAELKAEMDHLILDNLSKEMLSESFSTAAASTEKGPVDFEEIRKVDDIFRERTTDVFVTTDDIYAEIKKRFDAVMPGTIAPFDTIMGIRIESYPTRLEAYQRAKELSEKGISVDLFTTKTEGD